MTDSTMTDTDLDPEDLDDESYDEAEDREPPEYNLRVSRDKVSVRLDCPDPHSHLEATVAQVLSDFTVLEIPVYPDAEILTRILGKACAPGEHLWDCPLIMGQEPEPPQDGRIEWARDFFQEGWAVDEDSGATDWWEKLERSSVSEGELLATLHNPVEGEPGLNVFGNEIPVPKPAKVKLRPGKGVRIEEQDQGVLFYATINGRLRHAEGSLAVDDIYVVKGNVSLETGNIHHTGAVQIQGDVETGATIEAEGDVIVKGMLDPCTITCGGSLTVGGGIVGGENHTLSVDGSVLAKYISEATLTAGGDVTVDNEIDHSFVCTLGRVRIEKGRIAGGTVIARQGIKVGEAGASGTAHTVLVAGVDHTLPPKLEAMFARIAKMSEAQDKIATTLAKVKKKQTPLTPDEARIVAGLEAKSRELGQAIIDANHEVTRLKREARIGAIPEVVMLKQVWTGTTIQLFEHKTVVKASIEKPRIAQLRKTRVRVLPLGEGNMPED